MKRVNKKEFNEDIKKANDITKLEIKAINEALEDVVNGRVHSHEDVMKETKKMFPHLFIR